MRTEPLSVYAPLRQADAVLAYLPGPVVYLEGGAPPPAPSYFLAYEAWADAIAKAHPELSLQLRAVIGFEKLRFYKVEAR